VIENCTELSQCEQRLSEAVQHVELLGQIRFSPADLHRLGTLIRHAITPDAYQGTRFLARQAPTCLACFLVWTGITGYREGNYWNAVHEATGLPDDPNLESKWGQTFLDFVKANDLTQFGIEGGHKYVTPILAHGGIPDACLPEFFERIVLPMVQHDLYDPTDAEEVISELSFKRTNDAARVALQRKYRALRQQARLLRSSANRAKRAAEIYDIVVSLWRDEEAPRARAVPEWLPIDCQAFRAQKHAEIRQLEEDLFKLREERRDYAEQVLSFTDADRQILNQTGAIDDIISRHAILQQRRQLITRLHNEERELAKQLRSQSLGVFSEPWDDRYSIVLSRLSFGVLSAEIKQLKCHDVERQTAENRMQRSEVPWWVWPVRVFTPLVLGLATLIVGIALYVELRPTLVLLASWVVCAGFVALAGLAGLRWYEERIWRRDDQQRFRDSTEKQQQARQRIARMLNGLPIAERHLESPPEDLSRTLCLLVHNYRTLCAKRNERAALEDEMREYEQRVREMAMSIGVRCQEDVEETLVVVMRTLQQAREHQDVADEARAALKDRVDPLIAQMENRLRAIRDELDRVDGHLAELGEGDIDTGLERLAAQRHLQHNVAQRREDLRRGVSDLRAIEQVIRDAAEGGKDKGDLQRHAQELNDRLEQIRGNAAQVKRELSDCPAAFPGVDEPIRRYLLYAGAPAEEFLVGAVSLLHQALTEGTVPHPDEVSLPDRVVEAFEKWWTEYDRGEPADSHGIEAEDLGPGERFRAPMISLDTHATELTVHLPPQRYLPRTDATQARLEIEYEAPDLPRQMFPLRVYARGEELRETQDLDVPLAFPASGYVFTLKEKDAVIRIWKLPGMSRETPFMAFDPRSGKLVSGSDLPKGRATLVLHQDSSIEPADCTVVAGMPLFGSWKDYSYWELDLDEVDELQVIDGQGQRFSISVSPTSSPVLGLVGVAPAGDIQSEELDVYVEGPPNLRIPVKEESELGLWRLSAIAAEENSAWNARHCRLSDLPEEVLISHVGDGWVDVRLANKALLGAHPVGNFTIRVRKSPYVDWRSSFCVVPGLKVRFGKSLYVPHETGTWPNVRAEISADGLAELVTEPPARVVNAKSGCYTVMVVGSETAFRGRLRFTSQDSADYVVLLTVMLPKVTWRLQGYSSEKYLTWRDTVEEVWLGDLAVRDELFLVVRFPPYVEGSVKLALGSSGKEEQATIKNQHARFDLLAFGEALWAGPSRQRFTLTFPESKYSINKVPLFWARTRWEAEDIECVQESTGRTVILRVSWSEKGRIGNKDKVIRLWRYSREQESPVIEQAVRADSQSAHLSGNAHDLPPGMYLLQLALRDPWSSTTGVSPPASGAPSTKPIYVVSIGDIRQGEVLTVDSIIDNWRRRWHLKGAYMLRIIGKIINRTLPTGLAGNDVLVTRTNEGWYVGTLEAVDPESRAEASEANPVKFEYDASTDQITAIEDKYGEGAMYCCLCHRLCWSQKAINEHRFHRLIGPVEAFEVRWQA